MDAYTKKRNLCGGAKAVPEDMGMVDVMFSGNEDSFDGPQSEGYVLRDRNTPPPMRPEDGPEPFPGCITFDLNKIREIIRMRVHAETRILGEDA